MSVYGFIKVKGISTKISAIPQMPVEALLTYVSKHGFKHISRLLRKY